MAVMQTQDNDTINNKPLSYEAASRQLEDLVEKLSAGGLSLEESLRCFEQGMALANYCSNLLDNAELRVQQVNNLPPEELAALLDRQPAPQESQPEQAPAPNFASNRRDAAPYAPPTRRDEPQAPQRSPEPQTGRGQNGTQSDTRQPANGRRPTTSGPQRRIPPEELDPLFDEI